jgi:hypothetical protein
MRQQVGTIRGTLHCPSDNSLRASAEDVVALFLEKRLLPADLVLAACKAVAAGKVHLEIGLVLNRIEHEYASKQSAPAKGKGVMGRGYAGLCIRTSENSPSTHSGE